jgi:hypothetical protein
MSRLLLSGVATVLLATALTACSTKEERALAWCQDNYSGYTMMECQHQMRQKYQR